MDRLRPGKTPLQPPSQVFIEKEFYVRSQGYKSGILYPLPLWLKRMTLVTLTKSKKSSSKDHGSVSCQIFTETEHRTGDIVHTVGHTHGTEQAKGQDDDIQCKRGRGCSYTRPVPGILLPTALGWETVALCTYYSGFKFLKIEFKGLGAMLFSGIPISDVGDLWPMLQRKW